jgi:Ulp1 family protease
VCLTIEEKKDQPWIQLALDPTSLYKPARYGPIDHRDLTKLYPIAELNDEILNVYFSMLSEDKRTRAGIKFMTTLFWPKLIIRHKKGYDSATDLLFIKLVSG